MKNSNRILSALAKYYTWSYIFYLVCFSVATYFLGKMFYLFYSNPVLVNQKDEILNTIFPTTSSVILQLVHWLMLPTIAVLSILLFRLLVRFVQAQKAGLSLSEQGAILSKSPRLLVMLYLLGVAHKVLGTFLPTIHQDMMNQSLPAWTVYVDLLTPNVTSSFNLILAVLIQIYRKNLLETDVLKKEAELVV